MGERAEREIAMWPPFLYPLLSIVNSKFLRPEASAWKSSCGSRKRSSSGSTADSTGTEASTVS